MSRRYTLSDIMAADCRFDPREEQIPQAIGDCLRPPPSRTAHHVRKAGNEPGSRSCDRIVRIASFGASQ